ncbi:O-antigen ligase family protein [Cellulophaga baltica]|uniref:O-antigen ligase family protein n=1 Tax=Cellulophaga baltica TaxID=76594 RepID=UPI002494E59A|nr:O-antigen ligase family protein [Cellulophaga baltica]
MEKKIIGFYLFAFFLPLPLPLIVSSIMMGILVINCLLLIDKKNLNLITVLFLLFFLSDYTSLLFSNRELEFTSAFNDVKISCLFIPFFIYNLKDKLQLKTILSFYILGVLVYILYCLLYYVYFCSVHPNYTIQIDNYLFWAIENRFPGTYHRTYIGSYILLAGVIVLLRFFKTKLISSKISYLVLFIIFFLSIFFLGSKLTMGLFTGIIGLLLITNYRFLIIPFLVVAAIVFYKIKDWFLRTLEKSIGDRNIYFEKSIQIIKENLLFGIGQKNIKHNMVEINGELTPLIPHNIFLNELLSNGVWGFLVIISLFSLIIYKSIRLRSELAIAFCIMILGIAFIEDYIYMQRGLFFFVFFSSLLTCNFNVDVDLSFFKKPLKKVS